MAQLKDEMIPLIIADEIQQMTKAIAREIERDYDGKELVLICPLKGSILFVADLCRQIKLPQEIEFVHVKSVEKGGTIRILKDVNMNLRGKHLLIVEEIIDTGRTLNFLKDRLMLARPASVKIATLLDKPARRELPLKPDYIGKTIEDRYVVGYGMDADEIGRNYRDIYFLMN